jgi:ABC-2 type transport system permease protein
MSFGRMLRQALTVARRDFTATVMTPTFLLFLLSPLLMIGFALVGSMTASSAAGGGEARERIVVIAAPDKAAAIAATDTQLRKLVAGPRAWPTLQIEGAGDDVAAQAKALLASSQYDVTAVLYGPIERPTILRRPSNYSDGNYLAQLAEHTLRAGASGAIERSRATIEIVAARQATSGGRSQAAFFATLGVFFLTLMLSGQAVGAMAEERSNKVIEVLAAAIPLESVFFGKLIGAFGSALLFVCFWGTLLAQLPHFVPEDVTTKLGTFSAAVGPIFPLLFVVYFTMAYMLQSAVFLGVGALAGTQREIQMLSLPITIFQFAMFGFASYAASHPGDWLALAAEIFPFSSPLAMAAHAANSPALWPHALAMAWQILWVAITVTVAARLFRRGVLNSGSPKRSKRSERRTIDTAVS